MNLIALENDLRNYIQSCRDYDGSVAAANGRANCLMTLYGSVPYEINMGKFVDMLMRRPTWNVEDSVKWCMDWIKTELANRPKPPKIF